MELEHTCFLGSFAPTSRHLISCDCRFSALTSSRGGRLKKYFNILWSSTQHSDTGQLHCDYMFFDTGVFQLCRAGFTLQSRLSAAWHVEEMLLNHPAVCTQQHKHRLLESKPSHCDDRQSANHRTKIAVFQALRTVISPNHLHFCLDSCEGVETKKGITLVRLRIFHINHEIKRLRHRGQIHRLGRPSFPPHPHRPETFAGTASGG